MGEENYAFLIALAKFVSCDHLPKLGFGPGDSCRRAACLAPRLLFSLMIAEKQEKMTLWSAFF